MTSQSPRRPGAGWLSEHPVAAEFDLASNAPVTPDQVAAMSSKKFWWRCVRDLEHLWVATPNNRVGRGSGCPYCRGTRVSDANRLSLNSPDKALLEQWDYKANAPLTPDHLSVGSSRKVWWACAEADDHRWQATVSHRV